MKENLIFEGKTYISARRASEISDYSADYIGQLCRAGKLDCRMVGRSWFVTPESLQKHKEVVLEDEVYRNRILNIRASKRASRNVGTSGSSIGVLPSVMATAMGASASRVFTPDRPLSLPENSGSLGGASDGETNEFAFGRKILIGSGAALAAIAIIFTSAAFSRSALEKVSSQARSAGVIGALQSVATFMSDSYQSLLSLFGGRGLATGAGAPAAMPSENSVIPSAPSGPTASFAPAAATSGEGLAVMPSSGAPTADEALKLKIQDSFSDQVEIRPDKSGTAGVITPVFREARGKDFIYVMVPVKSPHPP